MGVQEDTVCLLVRQQRLKDEFNDPGILPMFKKGSHGRSTGGHQRVRLHHGVIRALLHIIWKTILVMTYGNYIRYVITDEKIITMMLHLPPGKSKILLERETS